jgi:hypothetical protein
MRMARQKPTTSTSSSQTTVLTLGLSAVPGPSLSTFVVRGPAALLPVPTVAGLDETKAPHEPPEDAQMLPYLQKTITWGTKSERLCMWQCMCVAGSAGCESKGECTRYTWHPTTLSCKLYTGDPPEGVESGSVTPDGTKTVLNNGIDGKLRLTDSDPAV